MKKIFATAGLAAALICPALGASAQNKPADKASQKFIVKAVEGNLAEVQMGQLAQEKAGSDSVRSFGQILQQDHSAAAQSSTAVATQIGATPPSEPNKQQKALHQSLSKLSGEAFDRKFTAEMVKPRARPRFPMLAGSLAAP